MVVTADTAVTEIDEALGHLADVRRTAHRTGDQRRERSLTQRIDYLLEQRFERACATTPTARTQRAS